MANVTDSLLCQYGGHDLNSLTSILNTDNDDANDDISLIKHSPYVSNAEFIEYCKEKKESVNILSLNTQSLNSKLDQIKILITNLAKNKFEFDIICLQETWITNITDLSAFQINGYTLIAQEAQCSSHAGLAIFIQQNLKYKVLDICKKSNIWEGLFVQVESPKLSKNL